MADIEDDQLFYQRAFLSGNFDIRLDNEAYLFQCHDPRATKKGYQLFNPNTRCFSCVYHGNGGSEAKRKLDQLHRAFFHSPVSRAANVPVAPLIHHDDMLVIDLLSSEQCAADRHGEARGWQSMMETTTRRKFDWLSWTSGDIELLYSRRLSSNIGVPTMHGVDDRSATRSIPNLACCIPTPALSLPP